MGFLKQRLKSTFRMVLIPAARIKASRLSRSENYLLVGVTSALGDVLRNRVDPEEMEVIMKIEQLRNELSCCKEKISVIDYGSGSPMDNLTADDMYHGRIVESEVCELLKASKTYFWALLLFKLIRRLDPKACLEMGTSLGISGAYQAAALSLNNNAGSLYTIEGAPAIAALAKEHFRAMQLNNIQQFTGRFQDRLRDVLRQMGTVDYAFVDGHHDGAATLRYFNELYPYLADKSIVVFDDICTYQSMRKAWQLIENDRRINVSLNLYKLGLCIFDKGYGRKEIHRIWLV